MIDLSHPYSTFIFGLLVGCLLLILNNKIKKTNDISSGSGEEEASIEYPDIDQDINTLRRTREDAQRVIDEALTTISDLSGKAIQMAQVNGLVLTILVAASGQVAFEDYINIISLLGVGLFLLSAVFSVHAYRTESFGVGIDASVIDTVLTNEVDEKLYHEWLLSKHYPQLLEEAEEKTNLKAKWVDWSIQTFLLGLGVLFTGIVLSPYL